MMEKKINLSNIYKHSDSVVARDVHEDFVLFSLIPDEGNWENGIFILNETGKFIWHCLDGKRTLKEVSEKIVSELEEPPDENTVKEIEQDVIVFAEELIKRKMIIDMEGADT